MTQIGLVPSGDGSAMWTLEEIGRLVSLSGDPSETLANVVLLIQRRCKTDVCSVYLLGPDRSSLVLAATIGLRPDSVGRVRMRLTEGLAGLVAEQLQPQIVADATEHPRFKYFPETGEDPISLVPGRAHRGPRAAAGRPRGADSGVPRLQQRRCADAADGRDAARRDRKRGTDARPGRGPRASTACGPRTKPLVELGQRRHERFPGDRSRAVARVRQQSHRAAATDVGRDARGARITAGPAQPNQLRVSQARGAPPLDAHVGRAACGRPLGQARRVLLGRIRPARIDSDLLRWPRDSRGRSHQERVGSRHPAGRRRPLLRPGILPPAAGHGRLAAGGVPERGSRIHADGAGAHGGVHVLITIETRTGPIRARVWKMAVGRNTLLLLDSNVEGTRPEDRELTARLYGGDTRVRVRQELLLGVGGVRALAALGISPGVAHLNEGHSAFAALELLRQRMEAEGIDAIEAIRRVAPRVVFTTHTPVPAGHDRFPASLIEEHLGPLRDALGLDYNTFMGLGRLEPQDPNEGFCMTVLALKLSRRANAVSSLHGQVSRAMWNGLFPGRDEDAVPIGHITNGVHSRTWLATEMRQVYDRHLGPEWPRQAGKPGFWDAISAVDDGELWETHQTLKVRLIETARRRATRFAERRGETSEFVSALRRSLSFDALTIGFARRFATYKRAALMLQDIDALAALVNDPRMPVQFIFAGKSHPHDHPGKQILQQIARLMHDPRFAGKILCLDDYDINVGRHLVQGVDVWANNPRRPLEACGTSGQKVILNGGLNLSILGGWWAEAYDGQNGFAFGRGETHTNVDIHDSRDGDDLLRVLGDEVIPLYYDRDRDGLPRGWIGRMKRAIRTLGWRFSADRTVMDYVLKAYIRRRRHEQPDHRLPVSLEPEQVGQFDHQSSVSVGRLCRGSLAKSR